VKAQTALSTALETRRILVVCGSGGVGKTTMAAALGLKAAELGQRVLVCTIDPSRRLATSLGLTHLPERPRALDLRRLQPRPKGSLWAMTLDTRRTFDALVQRYATSAEAREGVLKNRFYREISSALAGSQEYMAMEKLLELSTDERFDLVVLDTPPTRHALDFLEAPERLMGFLDTSVLRWFLKPYFVAGRLTLRVATRTGAAALRLADRTLGLRFLQDLSEFFLAFEGMYDGFKERAGRVHQLLRDPRSGFILVASPVRETLEEALYFHGRLREKNMPFVGFVVNRVHENPAELKASRESPKLDPDLATHLLEAYRNQQTLSRVERRGIARLQVVAAREPILFVPEFEADVHDLRGLRDVAEALLPSAEGGRRGARSAS
jgi:anion-transporting  ArsA/GET3 family ATPase